MVVLLADQFELLADDAAGGFVFGTASTGYITLEEPGKEPGDVGGNEFARSREDGVNYGEEWEGAAAVTFSIGALGDRNVPTGVSLRRNAEDALDRFESEWRAKKWRNRFGVYAVLRSNIGGVTRRCYGRPRRYAATADYTAKHGYASFLCDFSVMDGTWYDDTPTLAASPASAQAGGTRSGNIDVGGTKEAWPVVTISAGADGNIVSPTVTVGGHLFAFPGLTIALGDTLTIDPRPWRRRVTKGGGTIVHPGPTSTLLQDFQLQNGANHLFQLQADTLPASATVAVSAANAWSRW